MAEVTRITAWLIAGALLVTGVFSLLRRPSPSFPPARRIAVVDFQGTPLEEAVAQLGKAAGVKIVLDRKALQDAEINLDGPVYLRLHDVALDDAFHCLDPHDLESFVLEPRGDELYATLPTRLPRRGHVYDVSDIISACRFDGLVLPNDMQWAAGGNATEENMESIVRLIVDTIHPDIWDGTGGTEYIGFVGTQITIIGPEPVHREVREALDHFRRCRIWTPPGHHS